MIEVRNIVKNYGYVKALDNVSFEVKKGEIVGFLGPNGAGKTTTMRIITGYLYPDSGDVLVKGVSVVNDPLEVKRNIGYLPEDNPLYYDMEVTEYLEFIGEARGVRKHKLKSEIDRVVETVDISHVLYRPIGELSKGYKQRVGLAQALLHDPEILILDEPTTGLDPTQIVEIRELIKQLGKEKTLIISTHILPEAAATSTRILIINKGKIVASGTPDELTALAEGGETLHVILKLPSKELYTMVESVLDQTDWIESFTRKDSRNGEIEFVIKPRKGEDIREKLYLLSRENDWIILEMWREKATLEDVFLSLITEEVAS